MSWKEATLAFALASCMAALGSGCVCFEPDRKPCPEAPIVKVTEYLPKGAACCVLLMVEKSAPAEVRVGKPFEYRIVVQNRSRGDLNDVTVWDAIPQGMKINKATPEVNATKNDKAVWELGRLAPGQKQTIVVEAVASSVSVLQTCAEVTFRFPPVCLAVKVVDPGLTLTKTAQAQAILCDAIPVTLTVKNTGTCDLCGVIVRDQLPDGLTTTDGRKELAYAIPHLAKGESKEFQASLKAEKPGKYINEATATADGDVTAKSNATTTEVVKPELTVTKSGPTTRYLGRPVTYEIKVVNSGTVATKGVILTDSLGAGTGFVEADSGGRAAGGRVVWDLGDMEPGQTKTVHLTVRGDTIGTISDTAVAQAHCAEASAAGSTQIQGISAILLECEDVNDPIEVGSEETYEIRVTNQGSAADTNIVIKATLPAQEQFISASGATKEAVDGQTITFAPLATLGPGQRATYQVKVKATAAGDVRFKVTLTSDQMTTPAEETEATTLYKAD